MVRVGHCQAVRVGWEGESKMSLHCGGNTVEEML